MPTLEKLVRPLQPSAGGSSARRAKQAKDEEAVIEWGQGGSYGTSPEQTVADTGTGGGEVRDPPTGTGADSFTFSEVERKTADQIVLITAPEMDVWIEGQGAQPYRPVITARFKRPLSIVFEGPQRVRGGLRNREDAIVTETLPPDSGYDNVAQAIRAKKQLYEFEFTEPDPWFRVISVEFETEELPEEEGDGGDDGGDGGTGGETFSEFLTVAYTNTWQQSPPQSNLIINFYRQQGWSVIPHLTTATTSGTTFEWVVTGTITFGR